VAFAKGFIEMDIGKFKNNENFNFKLKNKLL
jgi:hypothetical protein